MTWLLTFDYFLKFNFWLLCLTIQVHSPDLLVLDEPLAGLGMLWELHKPRFTWALSLIKYNDDYILHFLLACGYLIFFCIVPTMHFLRPPSILLVLYLILRTYHLWDLGFRLEGTCRCCKAFKESKRKSNHTCCQPWSPVSFCYPNNCIIMSVILFSIIVLWVGCCIEN